MNLRFKYCASYQHNNITYSLSSKAFEELVAYYKEMKKAQHEEYSEPLADLLIELIVTKYFLKLSPPLPTPQSEKDVQIMEMKFGGVSLGILILLAKGEPVVLIISKKELTTGIANDGQNQFRGFNA